jgi:chaperone modulatory protein CbpM
MRKSMTVVTGVVIDENYLDLAELTEVCGVTSEMIYELVEQGLLTPRGRRPEQWAFSGAAVRRIRQALRLAQDLEINLAGAALAVDLLEERERLYARIRELEYRLSLQRYSVSRIDEI